MNLRCKPGDLAVVVKIEDEAIELLGRIVKVTTLDASIRVPVWNIETPITFIPRASARTLNGKFIGKGVSCTLIGLADESLCPLRGDVTDDAEITKRELESV